MRNKRMLFVLMMLTITMINPGCKHEKHDAKFATFVHAH